MTVERPCACATSGKTKAERATAIAMTACPRILTRPTDCRIRAFNDLLAMSGLARRSARGLRQRGVERADRRVRTPAGGGQRAGSARPIAPRRILAAERTAAGDRRECRACA